MSDWISIKKRASEIEGFLASIKGWAIDAGRLAIKVVRDQVVNLTPIHKGGLRENVHKGIFEEEGGLVQGVKADGVVAEVMENNGRWTKPPPFAVIKSWVETKLFKTGEEAEKAAWAIRQKIYKRGLTLPNKQGLGQMFKRTQQKMVKTGLWFYTFKAALKALASK